MKRARVECRIRGIGSGFCVTTDPLYAWKTPCFKSKEECSEWVEKYVKSFSSHPHRSELKHLLTTWVCWEDVLQYMCGHVIDSYLYPECMRLSSTHEEGARCPPATLSSATTASNPLLDSQLHARVKSLTSAAVYSQCPSACSNTMRYLFHHMRCGIYVSIRRNKIECFVPFANEHYKNTWSHQIKFKGDRSAKDYEMYRRACLGPSSTRHRLEDPSSWWANAGIICETPDPQVWGDSLLAVLRSAFEQTCDSRYVPDCDFFVNKRDHPQMRAPDVSADVQRFLWATGEPATLRRERYLIHVPVLSFYTGPSFLDIPIPTHEDWMAVTGASYPPTLQQVTSVDVIRVARAAHPWETRISKVVWRGSDTGPKQRTQLCHLCSTEGFLKEHTDVAITQWSSRDKIDQQPGVVYFEAVPREVQQKAKSRWMSVEEQIKYKYTLYISGHSAASRFAAMMLRGSVILYVRPPPSVEAHRLWFDCMVKAARVESGELKSTHLTHNYQSYSVDGGTAATWEPEDAHVIVIEQDLSNLEDTLKWCLEHDVISSRIAANAVSLGECVLGDKNFMLDYMQVVLLEIARLKSRPTHIGVDSAYSHPWSPRMIDISWPPSL